MQIDEENTDKTSNKAFKHPQMSLDQCILKLGDVLSLLFVLTVAISLFEVVMRYCFNAPTIWVHESASFIGGALFIYGGIYSLANDKHVRVVLIYDHVSERAKQCLNIFHSMSGLILSTLLIYGAWLMVTNAWLTPNGQWRLETSGSAWNPVYPALLKGVILLVLLVMFLQFALHLVRDIRLVFTQSGDARNV